MAFPTATAIQTGGNILSTTLNQILAKKRLNQQTQANKELSDYQFAQDQSAWNQQNKYNSPEAQMQRYSEAGLNPNLMYGQGSPGNAQQMPKYQAQKTERNTEKLPNIATMSMHQDFQLKKATIDNINAKTETEKARKIIEDYIGLEKSADAPYYEDAAKHRDYQTYSKTYTQLEFLYTARHRTDKEAIDLKMKKWEEKYLEDNGQPPPKDDWVKMFFTTLQLIMPNWRTYLKKAIK